ncbi:hypothetical protein SARC_08658 [Sphaeroforma arctica JP610]|uniref:SGNH hydrolase-type esterase domain-containing protein n=1 Tax=Sphaeroforma arctica JP610 TaxID=667725 RepID=A0A0L0FQE6_9EUKA|nr:hypothetical protein SARC_08658 [Sphaeroforma arctica JP610]KNC78924.1 hypothetical protein SARC_08658 [Sphaeroforma arctica JP610]|eukprot:XP_014152826.1 hypothetical protein SARC_08658 [Sphaeroforma arctica JP610]
MYHRIMNADSCRGLFVRVAVWLIAATTIAFCLSGYFTHYHVKLYKDYEEVLTDNWDEAEEGDFDAYERLLVCPVTRTDDIRIACVGDSITRGNGSFAEGVGGHEGAYERGNYPAELDAMLNTQFPDKNVTARNYGVSGAQTLIAGADLPYFHTKTHLLAVAFRPNVLVVMLGTNDAKVTTWNDATRDQFKREYLRLLMSFSYRYGCRPQTWLMAAPPVIKDIFGVSGKALHQDVNPTIRNTIAHPRRKNMPLIDMEELLAKDKTNNFYIDGKEDGDHGDGLHPCLVGTQRMARAVYDHLKPWITNLPVNGTAPF